jgi:hypothetical protein
MDSPNRAVCLSSLADALRKRYEISGFTEHLDDAIQRYEDLVHFTLAPPFLRIRAVSQVIKFLYPNQPKRMNKPLNTAIPLLQTINPRTLDRSDQQFISSACSGLAAMSAAVSLEAGDTTFESLRLLELGRGVMAAVQLQTRSDLTALEEEQLGSELVEKFKRLQKDIALPPSSESLSWKSAAQVSQSSQKHLASTQFDTVVEEIRALPGFQSFLLGPSSNELMVLASSGPIVVLNVAATPPRSDAFIITSDSIHSMPLPLLRYADLERKFALFRRALETRQLKTYAKAKADMKQVLGWLWDVAVGLVLNALGFTECPPSGTTWPRIWWIGNGMLSFLPIHAAGYHSDGSGRNALDRVISSYAPIMKSLAYAREKANKITLENQQLNESLFICMPETPKQIPLRHVEKEVRELEKLSYTTTTKHILMKPKKKQVLSLLETCQIAHFACHGRSAVDNPSKSTLLLNDWQDDPLTVADIARLQLKRAQLAYLSACQTADNIDEALLDEGIHLAGACQLAGFSQVVGTLWEIDDYRSVDVAIAVYATMMNEIGTLDTNEPAEGLHWAVRRL